MSGRWNAMIMTMTDGKALCVAARYYTELVKACCRCYATLSQGYDIVPPCDKDVIVSNYITYVPLPPLSTSRFLPMVINWTPTAEIIQSEKPTFTYWKGIWKENVVELWKWEHLVNKVVHFKNHRMFTFSHLTRISLQFEAKEHLEHQKVLVLSRRLRNV